MPGTTGREQSLVPFYFLFTSINDLPNCLTSCQPRMYADETHITYADVDVNSIQLNLNHNLDNLNKWLISNKLTLNTAKTEFILIGSRQKLRTLSSPPELSIDNFLIGSLHDLITWPTFGKHENSSLSKNFVRTSWKSILKLGNLRIFSRISLK